MTKSLRFFRLLALLLLVPASGWAQWTNQIIALQRGWNAVYCEVQPQPAGCDAVFAGLPVESVWGWNRRSAALQYIQDPNTLVVSQPDWLTYWPQDSPQVVEQNLFTLEGGKSYLIKMPDSGGPFTLTLSGIPSLRRIEWLADAANLVGFPLPTSNPPTFRTFLTNSAALRTNQIYRLNPAGNWVLVSNPATNLMQRGEAFWIRSTGLPDFAGPLEVQLDRRGGLDFGRVLTEQTLRIRNPSTNTARTIILRQLVSDTVPVASGYPARAGDVPLSYWQNDFASNRAGWTNLPAQLIQSNVPPGGVWELRLEVRRRDMAAYTPPPGVSNAFYQSLLEVTDSANTTRQLIPVMSEGLQSYHSGGGAGFRAASDPAPIHPRAGLWIGSVSINKVSQPSSGNPLTPVPTGSEFQFRILVHVNATGQATLLQKVLQMWKPGQTNAAGELVEDGRFVLLTDESLISSQYTGAAVRDGRLVGRRFSTAAFGFRDPLPMTGSGSFGDPGIVFNCTVAMSHTNALNPFVHLYHPDHNNLDDRQQPLTVKTNATGQLYTAESTAFTRALELHFEASNPDNAAQSGWGDTQLGGTYRESIFGIHRAPLVTQGSFTLQQATRVALLNQ